MVGAKKARVTFPTQPHFTKTKIALLIKKVTTGKALVHQLANLLHSLSSRSLGRQPTSFLLPRIVSKQHLSNFLQRHRMLHNHRKAWMSIWGIYHLSQQKLCTLPPVLMLINHRCRLASALLTLKLPLLRLFSQCITHLQRLYLAWRQSMLHQAITRPPHLLPSPYSQWTIHLQLNLSKQLWRRYQRQIWKTKTPRFHLNLKSLPKTQKLKWIVRR